jgi:hypothetical protein
MPPQEFLLRFVLLFTAQLSFRQPNRIFGLIFVEFEGPAKSCIRVGTLPTE